MTRKIFKNLFAQELIAALLAVAVFGTVFLAVFVHFHPVTNTDVLISRELQNRNAAILPPVLGFVSWFGDFPVAGVMLAVFALVFAALAYRREAIFLLLTLPVDGFNYLIKLLVNRPRPGVQFVKVYERLTDPSFPSGHVVHYVVFFGFIFAAMFAAKRLPFWVRVFVGGVSLLLIFLVSISRIYLGVHWATDVVGGYFVGFSMLFVLLYFYLRQPAESVAA